MHFETLAEKWALGSRQNAYEVFRALGGRKKRNDRKGENAMGYTTMHKQLIKQSYEKHRGTVGVWRRVRREFKQRFGIEKSEDALQSTYYHNIMADARPAPQKKAVRPPEMTRPTPPSVNGFSDQVKGWMDRAMARNRTLEAENKRLKEERERSSRSARR